MIAGQWIASYSDKPLFPSCLILPYLFQGGDCRGPFFVIQLFRINVEMVPEQVVHFHISVAFDVRPGRPYSFFSSASLISMSFTN